MTTIELKVEDFAHPVHLVGFIARCAEQLGLSIDTSPSGYARQNLAAGQLLEALDLQPARTRPAPDPRGPSAGAR